METKEIIQALKCCHNLDECEDCEYNELGEFCEELLKRDAAKRLEELEAELGKRTINDRPYEWISVEDDLPKESEKLYWVYRKNGSISLAVFYNEKKPYWSHGDATHWFPLPEPPNPKEPTFKDKFLEAFPKAQLYSDGIPIACRANIFGEKCLMKSNCFECWNQPYFESEEEGEADGNS